MKLLHSHQKERKAAGHQFGASLKVPAGIHGALDFGELQQLGLNTETVLDFSANMNPYGPSETVLGAIARVSINRYPDRKCAALCHVLAELQGVPVDHILPGNGVSELIWLAALAFVRPGERVLVMGPTYCEYARVAELQGGSRHYGSSGGGKRIRT